MLTKSIINTAAGIEINLTGNPNEVSQEVNRLYNYGSIERVDESYVEGFSESVTLKTNRRRLIRGLLGIAANSIFDCFSLLKFKQNKKAMRMIKIVRAAHLLKQFNHQGYFEIYNGSHVRHFEEADFSVLTHDSDYHNCNTAITT